MIYTVLDRSTPDLNGRLKIAKKIKFDLDIKKIEQCPKKRPKCDYEKNRSLTHVGLYSPLK